MTTHRSFFKLIWSLDGHTEIARIDEWVHSAAKLKNIEPQKALPWTHKTGDETSKEVTDAPH
jgi:hypothetical protein